MVSSAQSSFTTQKNIAQKKKLAEQMQQNYLRSNTPKENVSIGDSDDFEQHLKYEKGKNIDDFESFLHYLSKTTVSAQNKLDKEERLTQERN